MIPWSVRTRLRPQSREGPAGFTLIEVLLVLALLVAVAAVALNSGINFSDNRALPRVADDFRGLFGDLRVLAMTEGRAYYFEYLPDSGDYAIRVAGAQLDSSAIQPSPPRFAKVNLIGTHRLEGQMKFLAMPEVTPPANSFVSELAGEGWTVAQFEPDGSSSDIAFRVLDKAGFVTAIRVHGRTGRITVDPPVRSDQHSAQVAGGSLR